jgi:thiol-disulfide isomerase/thioredoxin
VKRYASVSLLLLVPAMLGAQEVSLAVGTQAPAAALEDLDGNPVQLLDFVVEGKPTLIEFWASWCENCEALQPQMEEIARRWKDRVKVVAVAVAVAQNQRRVKRHVEDHAPGYPYLWDAKGEAVRAYGAATTSIVVILDGDGKVAYTGVGRNQDLVGAMRAVVEG